ncbi:MAG TPA: hypothetical protein PKZ53_18665, partial [Acidobacteriota bacterium]|nr:hypothetical protein [Acidobacteriota bacterium]
GFYCLYSIEEEELRLVSFSAGYNGLERIKIKYGKGKEFLGQKPARTHQGVNSSQPIIREQQSL